MEIKHSRKGGYEYSGIDFKIMNPILDIGGGPGVFLELLDIKEADIIDLTENKNKKYNYIPTDISKKLPELPYKKYGTIFAMEILEHLRNPLYLMAQVYDILEDEGTCYIAVPHTPLVKKYSSGNWDLGHVSRWKLKEIISQMEKIGFNVKVVKTRRKWKNTAFFLPYKWIVLELNKRSLENEKRKSV
jgi:predicted SAM-dependent methyltransferase